MDGYLTIKETAEKWNISSRSVQKMCADGRIVGAQRLGIMWAIPENAIKPKDERIKSGKYKNWRKPIKLGE